jgi:hypothetical protein
MSDFNSASQRAQAQYSTSSGDHEATEQLMELQQQQFYFEQHQMYEQRMQQGIGGPHAPGEFWRVVKVVAVLLAISTVCHWIGLY